MVKLIPYFMTSSYEIRAFRHAVFYFMALLWAVLPLYASRGTGSKTDPEGTQIPGPVFLEASLGGRSLLDTDSRFPHEFNTLEVEYAVPGYPDESRLEYAMRLRGLETDWHSTQYREARYPALAPGSYVFQVRSRLGSGPWSYPAALEFEIQQPWWYTWQAITAWIFLIASALCALFFWRLQKYRKRALELENILSARTIELAMANADLERLSITDPLTGLKNRRFVEFSITEDLARVRRSLHDTDGEWQNLPAQGASISFLLIDIDFFKRVNDRFGHGAGDMVLRQMSQIFTSVIRESDTTVRWGGEEFLIIARSSQVQDAAALAQRICGRVQSTAFDVNDEQTIQMTCSIGYASWPFFRCEPDALKWREVLELADRCLYIAKNSGRNSWIGVRTRTDYAGPADTESLNDFRSAEAKGIIRIESSLSPGRRIEPYYGSSRRYTRVRTYP